MNLSDALLDAVDAAAQVYRGTATGGSTTTLADSLLGIPNNDVFNGGALFFLSGANAGVCATITDFVGATGTFSFATLQAVGAGVGYAATRVSRSRLVMAVQTALDEYRNIQMVNTALLVTADTEQYTLPAGVSNLFRVEIARNTAQPYGWSKSGYWRERDGVLMFLSGKQPTDAGKTIRLWYNAPHPAVSSDTDPIDEVVSPYRLKWTAAYHLLLSLMHVERNNKEDFEKLLALVQNKMNEAAVRYPIRYASRDPIFNGW